jgi:hypothetical protein
VAKGLFDFLEILVMRQHSAGAHLLGSGVGSQQIETIPNRLGLDGVGSPAPLRLAFGVDRIIKILVGLEPL